jgi:predicted transposase YdaD
MLGITLKETRVYREIKEEGREEGHNWEMDFYEIRKKLNV